MKWGQDKNNLRLRSNSTSCGTGGPWSSRFGGPRWQKFGGAIIILMAIAKMFDPGRKNKGIDFERDDRTRYSTSEATASKTYNAKVQDAVQLARNQLDDFIDKLNHPTKSQFNFAVKARFYEAGQTNYFWVDGVAFDGSYFTGNLSSSPPLGATLSEGDGVCIPLRSIVDWYYEDDGEPVGAFTVEVLKEHLLSLQNQQHGRPTDLPSSEN